MTVEEPVPADGKPTACSPGGDVGTSRWQLAGGIYTMPLRGGKVRATNFASLCAPALMG
jgi:hypothetical protein